MDIRWMSLYNGVSVVFYAITAVLVKHHDKAVTALVHGEVCLFVTLAVSAAGWDLGFQLLLLSTASMVYFCPYRNKYVPYFFGGFETLLFMGLYVYASARKIAPQMRLCVFDGWAVYLVNAAASFGLILYGTLVFNLSSKAAKRQLFSENASLELQATHDSLTGLCLRRSAEKWLDWLWKRRELGIHFAVAMGDIDNFKQVNDTYGHDCGDRVLREVAKIFTRSAGVEASICRWGGEEFLLFFRGSEREEAVQTVQELCQLVAAAPIAYPGGELRVTVTFGVCDSREAQSVEEMLALADKRLYAGKSGGKNRVIDAELGMEPEAGE